MIMIPTLYRSEPMPVVARGRGNEERRVLIDYLSAMGLTTRFASGGDPRWLDCPLSYLVAAQLGHEPGTFEARIGGASPFLSFFQSVVSANADVGSSLETCTAGDAEFLVWRLCCGLTARCRAPGIYDMPLAATTGAMISAWLIDTVTFLYPQSQSFPSSHAALMRRALARAQTEREWLVLPRDASLAISTHLPGNRLLSIHSWWRYTTQRGDTPRHTSSWRATASRSWS